MIEGVVYRYVSPDGKSYVGQTTNEKQRRIAFAIVANNPDCQSSSYRGGPLRDALKKFGRKAFTYEVLFRGQYQSKEEAQADLWEKEKFFISYFDSFNNGYNQTIGGNGTKGHIPTKEQVETQRQWLIEYYKTHPNPFKGKRHTEENKKRFSEYAKKRTGEKSTFYGKKHSERAKKLMSESAKLRTGNKNHFFGKVHNDKTKQLISEANGLPVLMIDPQTNEVVKEFCSARKAGEYFGNPKINSEIIKCCKGYVSPSNRHYITCKGYKWKYKDR